MNFAKKIKGFLADLLALDEDPERELTSPVKSFLFDYQDLIESQAPDGSDKVIPHEIQKIGFIGNTPPLPVATSSSALASRPNIGTPREVYYPASLDGLKRQLAAMHQRNLALEEEVTRLNNEIVSIRERAKKLGAALFESAL